MKLRFKHQTFQAEAAKAVVDVFAGQPYLTQSYMIDAGVIKSPEPGFIEEDFTGWRNEPLMPAMTDEVVLKRIQEIQKHHQITVSDKLEDCYNLTVEMETGVGKTYTYIKTMYELNRHYGWTKFIVVVPSVAIREGVYKSFQVTEDHFVEEYGKKIRYFIYNSKQLTDIDRFASDSGINVMIINAQAFNASGKDARRIYMELDEFRSRRPIDIIAKTNPIVIIDEPQSVEGAKTKENLKTFHPLMTLRYSATHKSDSIYNMVYRLDAMEAYNKRLVKKIAVKGITESGSTATDSYVYLESINLSKSAPTATIQFDCKGASSIRKITRTVKEGYNLYDHSGNMEEYKEGFVVSRIDGRDDSIEFINGIKLYAGDVIGKVSEEQIRRIQIRETILSHIERERELFYKGIKVLSLFFIYEVAKYKQYNEAKEAFNGIYADMFEEEYKDIVGHLQTRFGEDDYVRYLDAITPEKTHAGYFSVDKQGAMVDSKLTRKETTTDDVSAYDLIMKNKELLLDRNPEVSPVRFIFSHSALREGWDNPNVFQICTLKQSSSEVRKRQEVGRGLRLCVNQDGERMDENILGKDVHAVNVLTVIASESYDTFAKGLQNELVEAIGDRPVVVSANLFTNRELVNSSGNTRHIDENMASNIYSDLREKGYIDRQGNITDVYYDDKENGTLSISDDFNDEIPSIVEILDTVFDRSLMKPENARQNNVELSVDEDKLAMPEFQALWSKINAKSVYVVDFDTDELVRNSIDALNLKLHVPRVYVTVESGVMDTIDSKADLLAGKSFIKEKAENRNISVEASSSIRYDLVGKLVEETGLTRKAVIQILQGIRPDIFNQFQWNPEEFILRASSLINDEKATAIIEHIMYHVLDETYDTSVFTDVTMKGRLDTNVMKAKKHLYDHVVYDSTNELNFAKGLDCSEEVAVYVKLPDGFYITTPVGRYNPDWAIAFREGDIKHIYFIAETKGSMNSMQLRRIEESKIHCAKEHFKAISSGNVVYDVVDSYKSLLEKVMR